MSTLILTGWGWEDYAVAAAIALRHHKQADIRGMSTRRLPEFLDETFNWKEIVILGINPNGNPTRLASGLRKQLAKGVRVTWITAVAIPDTITPQLQKKITLHVDEAADSLAHIVSRVYRIPFDDIAPLLSGSKTHKSVRDYHQLLQAAMYAYRNYQDEHSYGQAIRHIAHSEPREQWTRAEEELVTHYNRHGHRELIGHSAPICNLIARINTIAPHERARVMIYGESGTGKETVALQIHNKSPRRKEPFIAFNCATVAPELLESRFFGHEKGAFTGATERKIGLFEQANGGTLFLDEIGELPLEAQGLLLRVLEGGHFTRLGGKDEITADVRLLTATHRNLAVMVRERAFREDLFHRLNVIAVRVPPLREHKEDIRRIADGYWLKQHRKHLTPKQIEALSAYDYPGNVRELLNLLERASVLGESNFVKLLTEHRQMTEDTDAPAPAPAYPDDLAAMTRQHVRRIYEKYDGHLSRTADALGISRNSVKKHLDS